MDQVAIIQDLLSWLDSRLDTPLTVEHVAAKSGYSKWHLQRMFKEVTGQSIGSYIRKRRLSKAAVVLRFTSKSILDIALQYHFDSQQTFTRAFKKQFNRTPAHYRRLNEWYTQDLCPPIALGNIGYPLVEYVTLPEIKLIGTSHQYVCTLHQIQRVLYQYRSTFWQSYLNNTEHIPERLYALHHCELNVGAEDEQALFYTTATEEKDRPPGLYGQSFTIPEGNYAKFHYRGVIGGLQEFILSIYHFCLPMYNIVRLNGYDIEIYYPDKSWPTAESTVITCDYFIPIKK